MLALLALTKEGTQEGKPATMELSNMKAAHYPKANTPTDALP